MQGEEVLIFKRIVRKVSTEKVTLEKRLKEVREQAMWVSKQTSRQE